MSSVLEGGCACGAVRYELHGSPIVVNACHCSDCRRLAGAAYVLNAWTETENVLLKSGELKTAMLGGGESGNPNEISFCGICGTTVWSRYHVSPGDSRFVRVGTLDDPAALPPDAHVWTRSKLPTTVLPDETPAFEQFYKPKEFLPPASMERIMALVASQKTE